MADDVSDGGKLVSVSTVLSTERMAELAVWAEHFGMTVAELLESALSMASICGGRSISLTKPRPGRGQGTWTTTYDSKASGAAPEDPREARSVFSPRVVAAILE